MIDAIRGHASARPGDLAVVDGDETVSWGQLLERIESLAGGLATIGVQAGDAVALVAQNSAEFVLSWFAITGLGAVVVPLNPQFKADELEFSFRTSAVRAVIADAQAARVCRDVVASLDEDVAIAVTGTDAIEAPAVRDLIARGRRLVLEPRAPDEDLLYQYSSGSTGRPKRVPRTHGGCRAEGESYRTTVPLTPADRIFAAVPLGHSYASGACLFAFACSGATLVILDDPNPFVLRRQRALELIERHRVTVFPGVPFNFRLLAEVPDEADLSSLRLCFSAGTPLPRATYDAFRDRYGLTVRQMYGSTETGAMTMNLDPDPDATWDSVGAPVHGVDIAVFDEDGTVLPPGVEGEVGVRSPAMTKGYSDMEELNRDVFRDGRYFTGDLGRLDEAGRLRLTGRRKLLIEVAGNKVDPVEVEDVLASHPAVEEAVVVGVRGSVDGDELVKAAVVRREPCDERELMAYCNERLANFKVPRIVEFVDEIPRSPVGKVLRKYLV